MIKLDPFKLENPNQINIGELIRGYIYKYDEKCEEVYCKSEDGEYLGKQTPYAYIYDIYMDPRSVFSVSNIEYIKDYSTLVINGSTKISKPYKNWITNFTGLANQAIQDAKEQINEYEKNK